MRCDKSVCIINFKDIMQKNAHDIFVHAFVCGYIFVLFLFGTLKTCTVVGQTNKKII